MKFSIRELLIVTVIAAILVAWWLDRSRLVQQLRLESTRGAPRMLQWDLNDAVP
ncbi:MAG: hypothetical protein IAF94_12650 [Pirellulaceae bacterium]|nr:hypothetical protein [Pirellulaceae bacterium]